MQYFHRRNPGDGKIHAAAGNRRETSEPQSVPRGGLFPGGAGLVRQDDRGRVPGGIEPLSFHRSGNPGQHVPGGRPPHRHIHENPHGSPGIPQGPGALRTI